jgi:hypothetical protein
MPEFTLHDEEHIFHVLLIMEKLVPEETLNFLSTAELMLLILTAFFHDVGMAPEERQIRAWKKDWDNSGDEYETAEYQNFERFCKTFPDKLQEMERFRANQKHAQANLVQEYLISEYIRETHADRARFLISRDWQGKIFYKTTDLTSEFAQLCFSHSGDASALLDMETSIVCDDDSYVCLPFIGVILRLGDLLDFDSKRTPSVLFSHLSVRNPISLAEWKKHRSINAWSISPSRIVFSARCTHPAIEASIRFFFDMIDNELKNCTHILNHISDTFIQENIHYYKIPLPPSVDRSKVGARLDISTGRPIYIYRDTRFSLDKKQVIDLLMGTKLYGKPDVALRELIQNSVDACLVRAKLEEVWKNAYEPRVVVRYYSREGLDFLEVEDNGIGMNQHIIDNYYAKIGSCYYQSREFYDLLAEIGADFNPISRFGIGILSCFMVSDSIDIETRRVNQDGELDKPVNVTVEGYDSIFYIREGKRKKAGTLSRLQLRNENPWKPMSSQQFITAVKSSVPNPPFAIEIATDKKTVKYDNSYFKNIAPSSLRERHWESDDNVKQIEIDLDSEVHGFSGRAIVGVLEQFGHPVDEIEVLSKQVTIDGVSYELSLTLNCDTNEIEKNTTSIDVTENGGIEANSHYSSVVRSRSSISIHGIGFQKGFFPDYFSKPSEAQLSWPFPILLVLDISGPTEIDLNSARTEIINNLKWQKLETDLAYVVLVRLFRKLSHEYAEELLEIYQETNNENFLLGLKRAANELSIELNKSE